MSETAQHTPTPWYAKPREGRMTVPIVSSDGVKLAEATAYTPYYTTAANADFIVRACNVHEDLLAACENALANLNLFAMHEIGGVKQSDDDTLPFCLEGARGVLRAAIEKARPE